ncbi:MAG: LOG family protein [Calditrichia bacterium]
MSRKAEKAYKDARFLNSPDARTIRILSEYLEPASRLKRLSVKDTVVFYGSARLVEGAQAEKELKDAENLYNEKSTDENRHALEFAKMRHKMSRYYDEARELARLLTQWACSLKNSHHRFLICSGGGPGIMEAANRGAADVPGAKSLGLNISIPMEQEGNPYITPELNFEFHYFFMRKFWFVYPAKALVIFPGGFGTLDELFELLTLRQTGKIQKKMSILLYGEEYWSKVLNFQAMVDHYVISAKDLELFHISNSPQEAFTYLKEQLIEGEKQDGR